MKIKFITVGSPHLSFTKEGIKEYAKRLSRFVDIQLIHVKENKDTDAKILKNIDNSFCIIFDEKGKEFSSYEFADFLENKKTLGLKLCFVIGGAKGHTIAIQERANFAISLSRLTFPHDVAMMLGLEAIYRACTINEGHPYHRD